MNDPKNYLSLMPFEVLNRVAGELDLDSFLACHQLDSDFYNIFSSVRMRDVQNIHLVDVIKKRKLGLIKRFVKEGLYKKYIKSQQSAHLLIRILGEAYEIYLLRILRDDEAFCNLLSPIKQYKNLLEGWIELHDYIEKERHNAMARAEEFSEDNVCANEGLMIAARENLTIMAAFILRSSKIAQHLKAATIDECFCSAARTGSLKIINLLIHHKAYIRKQITQESICYALGVAVRNRNINLAKIILNKVEMRNQLSSPFLASMAKRRDCCRQIRESIHEVLGERRYSSIDRGFGQFNGY